jgi:hypothetical protein
MQNHDQILIRVKMGRYALNPWCILFHVWPQIRTDTCSLRYMPGSWYTKKHVYTRPALDTGQHMKILDQSWYIQAHAATLAALSARRHMLKHDMLFIHANTCRHTLSSECVLMHVGTPSALVIQGNFPMWMETTSKQFALCSWTLGPHNRAWSIGAYLLRTEKV